MAPPKYAPDLPTSGVKSNQNLQSSKSFVTDEKTTWSKYKELTKKVLE